MHGWRRIGGWAIGNPVVSALRPWPPPLVLRANECERISLQLPFLINMGNPVVRGLLLHTPASPHPRRAAEHSTGCYSGGSNPMVTIVGAVSLQEHHIHE
jgi:hypothetical protein